MARFVVAELRLWKGPPTSLPTFQIQASGQEAEIHTMLLHAANVIKRYKGNTCCWICHHSSCPHGGCSMCSMALGCRPIGLGNVHSGAGLWPSAGPSVLWRIEIISLQITSGEVEGTKSLWKTWKNSVPDCTKLIQIISLPISTSWLTIQLACAEHVRFSRRVGCAAEAPAWTDEQLPVASRKEHL